jgi:hypothetical protein
VATELQLELFEPEADQEAVDERTDLLRRELLELDVDSVSPVVSGPAPAGSKGLDLAAVGALLVQVATSVQAVGTVVDAVRSWLRRDTRSRRSVKITVDGQTLELTAATDAQQQRLVEEFLRAVSPRT